MTSQMACHYSDTIGLRERLAFTTDSSRRSVVALSHDVLDLKYMASLERTSKKKRLMQEVVFENWEV